MMAVLALATRTTAAEFDLAGPVLRVAVARGGVTLPLSQVPDLAAGDRISVTIDLPREQGARYRLVLAFLRGATNPPPKKWLFDAESWKPKKATISAIVPVGAEQAMVLLVPETRGALDAVSSAIRGRPGAFVRASQELNQAGLGSARLNAFFDALRQRSSADAAAVAPALAKSLGVKPDPECLQRSGDTRTACLTQGSNVAVFADSQTNSIAQTLAGAPADIALQLSGTPQGGYGYYSPYIGVVRDLARILGAFQSAQLQFIPALNLQLGDTTPLLLNTVPSFRKPQSVLVAALPPISAPVLPPLEPGERGALCATQPDLVLPVTGAPLVFATGYARQMSLRVRAAPGQAREIPLLPDPVRGGYRLAGDAASVVPAGATSGTVHGLWGFTPFEGPSFRLTAPTGAAWQLSESTPLVVGRDTPITLTGGAAACVAEVWMQRGAAKVPIAIGSQQGERLALNVPLDGIEPGPITVMVRSHGVAEPQALALRALSESSRLIGFTLHSGDRRGVLTGTRLDQVATLQLAGVTFRPGALSRDGAADRLDMVTDDAGAGAGAGALPAGKAVQATVRLADGRTMPLRVTPSAARPVVTLVSKAVEAAVKPGGPGADISAMVAGGAVIPQNARVQFAIRGLGATRFTADTRVEVRADDPSVTTRLPLRLQDASVAIGGFVPETALGASAHGPLVYRVIEEGAGDDAASDWMPFATLVRVPTLSALTCPPAPAACTLQGTDLFLIRRIVGDVPGAADVVVPDGFAGTSIGVPHTSAGQVRVVLRDAADAVAVMRVTR